MLDPNIFPELNSAMVQDWVRKIIEGYPFIERVLLYRDMKGNGSHVLVYVIPDKQTLIKTEDPGYLAFNSFGNGFNRYLDLGEVFPRDRLPGSGHLCNEVEAVSEKDEALKSYIVDGSSYWVLYEKSPQGTDIGDEQLSQEAKEEITSSPKMSDFDKSLMAFAKRKFKKNPYLSIPAIAKLVRREGEDFLLRGRCRNGKPPKQESIEKRLRKLLKK
jgi:hypothetical protein